MSGDSDLEHSRSPKRRRISDDEDYSSLDELAASSDTPYHPQSSISHREPGDSGQRRAYADSISDDSPDELDHTVHTFYRDGWNRSRRQSRSALSMESLPITPQMTIPPIQKASFVPYKEKLIMRGHRKGVAAVRFSPDARLIASCCE